ncbi:carbohydrate kinase family protein [Kosmotoga sp. DU53]|uniref:carbohydrate kinase family protein n=1 Tax=Kosmotoga sp. DU53 TaxID=1310160 RepID=UPI0007C43E87|nr:carbohydrate kinase [Kosmotoga sp. DU53]MDK2953940.1 fructokinase [Kosmotoga sp.]
MKKILIIGELLIDLISEEYVDDLADAKSFKKYYAGSPGNLAINLKNLGIEPLLLASVGDDPFGRGYKKWLEEKGIKTTFINRSKLPTSFVIVSKSQDTPLFMPIRGADYKIDFPQEPEKLFEGVEFIHLTSWPLSRNPARKTVMKVLEIAKKRGIKVCFDPNYREILWENGSDGKIFIRKFMKDIYLVKPSLDDSFHIFGKMSPRRYINEYHKCGVEKVVLTLGKDGVLVSDGEKVKKIHTYAKNVVDTTGAGDAFWSGLYHGLLEGFDVFGAAKIGNAAAAFRLETEDKSVPIPSIEVLKKIMETRSIS